MKTAIGRIAMIAVLTALSVATFTFELSSESSAVDEMVLSASTADGNFSIETGDGGSADISEIASITPVPAPDPTTAPQPGLQYIDNRLVYADSNCIAASSLGIDTSFYNGSVDFELVKKAGIDFAIIRLGGRGWGNGSLYTDLRFLDCLRSAQKAGLKTGVYFYSMAANRGEAKREALYVIEKLDGLELELPVYFDMEFSGDYPNGRTDRLTTAERVDYALAFCETIEDAGYEAGVYANESFFVDELNIDALSGYSLWVASYTEGNARPSGDYYDIWQFTDSVRIPGISGTCDLNAVF